MNSIATMPNRTRTLTAEALALKAAIKHSGLKNGPIAEHLGVSEGLISQWTTGHRPVPADKARPLAKLLGVKDPGLLSAAFNLTMAVHDEGVAYLPALKDRAMRPDLVIARLENDIDALRYTVAALVATMTVHRPAEAADAARALRRMVPARFRESGLVHELASILERAEKA